MRRYRYHGRTAALFVSALLVAAGPDREGPVVVRRGLDEDPGWDGRRNRPDPSDCVDKVQDFGWGRTRHAGGAAGEIGGRVSRSLRPSWFARVIPPKTLEDRLRASGRFAVTRSEAASGVLVGWFNRSSRGWRTPSSLVFRIDGERGAFRVFFEYGTGTWKTGGGQTFEGAYQTNPASLIPADGTAHSWSLDYDPSGARGAGEIVFTLDGSEYRAALRHGHRAEGASFDRFGILNQQISGQDLSIWLDDVDLAGESFDFADDPGWEGRDNRVMFRDCALRPIHDFGWSPTAFAGGSAGEVGGLVWRIESDRPERAGYYGAPVGRLSLSDPLEASGRLCLRAASADSAVLVGWFHSLTPIGAPPQNFLGLLIEGPSRAGHWVRPALGTSDDRREVTSRGPEVRPDGASHRWTLRYTPARGGLAGRIETTLDGRKATLPLDGPLGGATATFDRFGIVSWHRGGHSLELYLDDLEFTSARPRGE